MKHNKAGVSALALAAVLASGNFAAAQDSKPTKPDFGTTMTLGGKGTAAQAAAADDTELTWCRRSCWGGGGWGWGWGWGGCGWRSWGVTSFSCAPVWYTPVNWNCGWSWPAPTPFFGGFNSFNNFNSFSSARPRFGGGVWVGISGTPTDTSAPAVSLNLAVANNPLVGRPTSTPGGTFRYDGGPANPIPLPKTDATPSTKATPTATGLPISLPKTTSKSSYTYKAYGEK